MFTKDDDGKFKFTRDSGEKSKSWERFLPNNLLKKTATPALTEEEIAERSKRIKSLSFKSGSSSSKKSVVDSLIVGAKLKGAGGGRSTKNLSSFLKKKSAPAAPVEPETPPPTTAPPSTPET